MLLSEQRAFLRDDLLEVLSKYIEVSLTNLDHFLDQDGTLFDFFDGLQEHDCSVESVEQRDTNNTVAVVLYGRAVGILLERYDTIGLTVEPHSLEETIKAISAITHKEISEFYGKEKAGCFTCPKTEPQFCLENFEKWWECEAVELHSKAKGLCLNCIEAGAKQKAGCRVTHQATIENEYWRDSV